MAGSHVLVFAVIGHYTINVPRIFQVITVLLIQTPTIYYK